MKQIEVIATNRKAFHDYFIFETVECGIVLKGTEVKSLRNRQVSLRDSYAKTENGEMFLFQMHISNYNKGNRYNLNPLRKRKLLLHKSEIFKLEGKTSEKGLALIPLKVYLKNGIAKIELGVARGKKIYDKREAIKRRLLDRETVNAIK